MTRHRVKYREVSSATGRVRTVKAKPPTAQPATERHHPLTECLRTCEISGQNTIQEYEDDQATTMPNPHQSWSERQQSIDEWWKSEQQNLIDYFLNKDDERDCHCTDRHVRTLSVVSFDSNAFHDLTFYKIGTELRHYTFCICTTINETLIRDSCFPSHSPLYAFPVNVLDLHRKFNNRAGVASLATTDIMQGTLH